MGPAFGNRIVRSKKNSSNRPGPGYPNNYLVDPDPATRDRVMQDYARELMLAEMEGREIDEARKQAFTKWLKQWYWEHNRLELHYTTHKNAIIDGNPDYAPKFQAFHRDGSELKLVRAPNQSGKTFVCTADLWFIVRGDHPFREIDPIWKDPSIHKKVLIVTGSEKNRIGVMNALWELCPVDLVDWTQSFYNMRNLWGKVDPSIQLKNNVSIIFRASNQDTDSLNSLTAHMIWIDEPPSERTIDEIRRAGLAKDGAIMMSFTPVGEEDEDFTWLRHYVEGDPDTGKEPNGNWSQHVIGLPDCPWISPEKIEKYRTAFRDKQFAQRFYGDWSSGVIDRSFTHFKEGGANSCVKSLDWDWWMSQREDTHFGVGIDYGELIHHNVAIFVAYNIRLKKVVIFAEVVNERRTTPAEDAEAIRSTLRKKGLTPQQVGIWRGDINSGGKVVKGESLNKMVGRALKVAILPPYKAPGSVDLGERRINRAFELDVLSISDECRNFLSSCRNYKGDGSEKDKKYKHALDGARYILHRVFDIIGLDGLQSRKEVKGHHRQKLMKVSDANLSFTL